MEIGDTIDTQEQAEQSTGRSRRQARSVANAPATTRRGRNGTTGRSRRNGNGGNGSGATNQELTDLLLQQIRPFEPVFHLSQQAERLERLGDERWRLTTSSGQILEAPVIVIAAGAGSFVAGPGAAPLRDDQVRPAVLAHPVADMAPEFVDGFFAVPLRGGLEDTP